MPVTGLPEKGSFGTAFSAGHGKEESKKEISNKRIDSNWINGYNILRCQEVSGTCGCGGMADAQDSKSCGGDLVWVQVPPSAYCGAK